MIGTIAMLPLFVINTIAILFAAVFFGTFLFHAIQACLKVCCCCFEEPKLTGSSLAKIPYIPRYFTSCSDSCAICLSEFQLNETVSPLHCDIKHVFHTECIKVWLIRNPICPLCKAEICPRKLKEFNGKAVR